MAPLIVPAPRPANQGSLVRQVPCPAEQYQVRAIQNMKGTDAVLSKLLPSDTPVYRLPVRSTAIRDLGVCQRLFFFRYRLGLTLPHEYKAAFKRGEWFHRAVALKLADTFFRSELSLPDINAWVGQLDEEFEKWLASQSKLAKDGIMPDGTQMFQFWDNATADFYKARAMALHFLKKWGALPDGFTAITVEKTIFCKVKGHRIGRPLVGRLDILAQEESTGYLWIIDHKTTSKSPVSLVGALSFDLQPQHHRLLAMAAFPDKRLAGVIHNIVQTPTIRYSPRGLDKGGPESFNERLSRWYDEREVTGAHDPERLPSLRSTVRFTGDEPPIDYMSLLRRASSRAAGFLRLSQYPRCSDNYICLGGTAGSACPFLRLCRHDNPLEWRPYFRGANRLYQQQDLLYKETENDPT